MKRGLGELPTRMPGVSEQGEVRHESNEVGTFFTLAMNEAARVSSGRHAISRGVIEDWRLGFYCGGSHHPHDFVLCLSARPRLCPVGQSNASEDRQASRATRSSYSDTVYYPIFTFQDSNGRTHEITSSSGQNPPAYKVGDTVTVLYQSEQPEDAKLDRFFDVWGWAAMLCGFAVVDVLVGLGMLVVVIIIQRSKHAPLPVHAA